MPIQNRNSKDPEVVSIYSSECDSREATIFYLDRETKITTKHNKERVVIVQEPNKAFSVVFKERGFPNGRIVYPHKDISYVESAAENWVKFIMDRHALNTYSS
ncbi:hypothetical protein N9578_00710 [bacterium]|nr:hypothetical protein [bacterium]